METLTALITNPIDAVSGLATTMVESVLPATPTGTAAGSAPNGTFTEDTLRMIMHNIFTGDSRLQGQMLSKYWAPASTYSLNEGLISLQDRDSFAQLLRGVQLFATVEPEVLEITSTPDRAVILLNLSLMYKAMPLTWSKYTRVQVPTTITLGFGPDPSALGQLTSSESVITTFKQELSLPDLLWWVPGWSVVRDRLWGPVSGKLLNQFVQLEGPLVSRFQEYVSNGAGYTQAMIWMFEDAATGGRVTHAPKAPPPPSADLLAAADTATTADTMPLVTPGEVVQPVELGTFGSVNPVEGVVPQFGSFAAGEGGHSLAPQGIAVEGFAPEAAFGGSVGASGYSARGVGTQAQKVAVEEGYAVQDGEVVAAVGVVKEPGRVTAAVTPV